MADGFIGRGTIKHLLTMTFTELWQEAHRRHSSPGAQQAWLRSQLSRTLDAVGLRWAAKNGGSRDRIVVGVAPDYSRDDVALLDRLARVTVDSFEVFFLSDCSSQEDIREYVPIDERVANSPVVGVWKNGALSAAASGFAARRLLAPILEHHGV